MDKQQALQSFWSQFGIPAFEETSVPDKIWDEDAQKEVPVELPYITYQKILGELDEPVFPIASVWTRGSSWKEADRIMNSINDALKKGGQILKLDEGRMWIVRGSPFAQAMSDDDKTIRRYLINISVEFFTE